MSARRPPLSVLDLVPIAAGSSARAAIANTIDLAQRVEAAGYHRYWLAEHHLNPGVASTSPAVLIALVADATRTIRVGSGAVLLGHQTALGVVEQFGVLDARHPGRIDLGLGRSASRPVVPVAPGGDARRAAEPYTTARGLLIPAPFVPTALMRSPRVALQRELLLQAGAQTPDYGPQVREILALLRGEYRSAEGLAVHAVPGEAAEIDVWILGSSAGESAVVAGELGLPFGANYHVSPSTVLEAVDAYRDAFRPSPVLDEPYVLVSADVVVAPDDETARFLASPYPLWVRSIRCGDGAIEFPAPMDAARHQWTDDDRELVADRVATQFVGAPEKVVAGLEVLVEEVGADELLVTTITHDHADRVRSYELLAAAWQARG